MSACLTLQQRRKPAAHTRRVRALSGARQLHDASRVQLHTCHACVMRHACLHLFHTLLQQLLQLQLQQLLFDALSQEELQQLADRIDARNAQAEVKCNSFNPRFLLCSVSI